MDILLRKINNVTFRPVPEIPGMHLAGDHEIDLACFHRKIYKVDRMFPTPFGKINQVVEGMFVGKAKISMGVLVMI
jgi:hypothetical protein